MRENNLSSTNDVEDNISQNHERLDDVLTDKWIDALADMWDASDDLTYSSMWADQCLGKIDSSENGVPDFDVEASLTRFLDKHSRLVESAAEKASKKVSRWKTRTVVIVAILVTLGSMVTAQALGLDVFGAVARWTDETFHFGISSADRDVDSANKADDSISGEYKTLNDALDACDISRNTVPEWELDGFSMVGASVRTLTDVTAIRAKYESTNRTYSLMVLVYDSQDAVDQTIFEKDAQDLLICESKGITYYIMSNNSTLTVTWMPQECVTCAITGELSVEEVYESINS